MNKYIKNVQGNLIEVDFFEARLDRPESVPQWLLDLEQALEAL